MQGTDDWHKLRLGKVTASRMADVLSKGKSGESASRKTYRRSDIIDLMVRNPDRYAALADEIMQAYSEGRVKS